MTTTCRPLRLLGLALLLCLEGGCVGQRYNLPPVATPAGRAGIVLHASANRVRDSIATQEAGDGSTLVNQRPDWLVFVKQVSKPWSDVLYDYQPTGAPYVRRIYTLQNSAGGTEVTLRSEQVANYRTDHERTVALTSARTRRNEQRDLLRLRLALEKP